MTQSLQAKKILTALAIGGVGFFITTLFFTTTQAALIGSIALLVALWTNEGLPLGVVSLLPIVLFPALGILGTKATAMNYSHPIIYLFLGGFLIAIAVEKSGLHIWLSDRILSFFPNTARGIITSLAIAAGLLSSILSNTTTTLLLISIALYLTNEPKLKLRFALAIAYGASIGGIMTPIGTPPNLILLGIMQENHLTPIPFFQWMWMVAPVAFIMFGFMSFLLGLGVKDVKIERSKNHDKLNTEQKKVLVILVGLIAILLVNAPIKPYWDGLGMSESLILLAAGLTLFLPPFNSLEWDRDSQKIPYKIMFLFGAGFSIAKAFGVTGLADDVASELISLSSLPVIMLLIAVAFMVTFMTEITSNTALISIMLPILYSVAQQTSLDPVLFMMVATICASYAFMLPIATAPNAIAMSSGVVDIKTMAKYGFILNIVGISVIVTVAILFWKHIL
jgi:sodium-dependent dicarboxylate transporter 2/3/5